MAKKPTFLFAQLEGGVKRSSWLCCCGKATSSVFCVFLFPNTLNMQIQITILWSKKNKTSNLHFKGNWEDILIRHCILVVFWKLERRLHLQIATLTGIQVRLSIKMKSLQLMLKFIWAWNIPLANLLQWRGRKTVTIWDQTSHRLNEVNKKHW